MDTIAKTNNFPKRQTDITIFDSDTHWTEPHDLWTSRAPAKYKDRVMQVRRSERNVDSWHLGDLRVGCYGPCVVRKDLSKQLDTISLSNRDEMSRATIYVPERLALMDMMGVGSQIVYPNAIGFGAATLLKMDGDTEFRLFHVRAYNDALADMAKESKGRLLGQMVLPFWDIEESVKEMTRSRKMGLTGVSMTSTPMDWHQPSLADEAWNPLWAAAEDLGAPLNFHIGSGTLESLTDNKAYWGDRRMFTDEQQLSFNGRYATFQGTALQMDNQITILNLLVSGILDRYPKLKFVSVESGLSWVPYLIKGMENQLREVGSSQFRNSFKRSPREAFRDQVFVTYWFEDCDSVDYYIKVMGAENCMFETDFPHPVSMYPDLQTAAVESTRNLTDQQRYKVLCGNAERLYGVKVGALGS